MVRLAVWLVALAALTIAGVWLWPKNGARSTAECAIVEGAVGGFVDIPGGGFVMGADPRYPEEGPPRRVFVSPFRLQAHEVTNGQFAAFVAATGYETEAERNGGSALFQETSTPEILMSWWRLDRSASWKTPAGVGSGLEGLALHPVVHVSLKDARAWRMKKAWNPSQNAGCQRGTDLRRVVPQVITNTCFWLGGKDMPIPCEVVGVLKTILFATS